MERTPTTPDTQPAPQEVRKEGFTISAIDALRAEQENIQATDGEAPEVFAERQADEIEQMVDAYLAKQGVDKDHPRYGLAQANLRVLSIDYTPAKHWYVGERVYQTDAAGNPVLDAEGNPEYDLAPSGRDKVYALQERMFGMPLIEDENGNLLDTTPRSTTDTEPTKTDTEPGDDEESDEPDKKPELTPEQQEELRNLEHEIATEVLTLATLRDTYLKNRAGSARRAVQRGEYTKDSVKEARDAYTAKRDELRELQKQRLELLAEEEIDAKMAELCLAEEHKVADEYALHRLEATGDYSIVRTDGEPTGVEEVKRGKLSSAIHKLYRWYGKQAGKSGVVKKALVLGGAGLAIGATAGLALGAVIATTPFAAALGAVGGATLAGKASRAVMATHIDKRSRDVDHTQAMKERDELREKLDDKNNTQSAVDIIDERAEKDISQNRRRMLIMGGGALVATGVGAAVGEALNGSWFDGGRNHATQVASVAPTAPEAPGITIPIPQPDPNTIAGFNANVMVESGNGYSAEIGDLFKQRGINLTPAQQYDAYQYLEQRIPNGHFFTNNSSYNMGGDYGIGRAGQSNWDAAALRELENWGKTRSLIR